MDKPENLIFGLTWEQVQLAQQGKEYRKNVPTPKPGEDTGADPAGDGTFKMYPSGDIVDFAERNRRLARFER